MASIRKYFSVRNFEEEKIFAYDYELTDNMVRRNFE